MKQRFVELLPATSIFLGIVAVVFSWKALSIAKETEQRVLGELSQLNPNVVVGFAEPYTRSASIGNGGSVLCTQRIRLINEGASPTSLVGFTLWLRDGNRKENYFTLESSAEEASTGNPREFNFSSGINGFTDGFLWMILKQHRIRIILRIPWRKLFSLFKSMLILQQICAQHSVFLWHPPGRRSWTL